MGIIIGKFKKKKTTLEVLETLDNHIKSIEEYHRNTEQTHKKIVGRFIVISVAVYLLTALLFYFYFFPATLSAQLYYIIPLLLVPVIILSGKRILTWYYNRKISKNQIKLGDLKEEKKKMLEKVMDTETYKVAKEILEKFAPEQVRKPVVIPSTEYTPVKQALTPAVATIANTGLRQRALPAPMQSITSTNYGPLTATPSRSSAPALQGTAPRPISTNFGRMAQLSVGGTPLPMPRSILPRERSVLDKMVEYLVGDGPSNRFALICSQCSSHNGMALSEEFEYISFRCCYCYTFNPARKKRPVAPKLEFDVQPLRLKTYAESSSSEKNSHSDTDSEPEDLTPPKILAVHKVFRDNSKIFTSPTHEDAKLSDSEKISDFDKLSDIEHRSSDIDKLSDVEHKEIDEEEMLMEVDESPIIKTSENVEEDKSDLDEKVDINSSLRQENVEMQDVDGTHVTKD